jgi:hypothetical protein
MASLIPSALTSRTVLRSGTRRTSGSSVGGRCCSAMARGTRWMHMPGRTRPARPARCFRLAWEIHWDKPRERQTKGVMSYDTRLLISSTCLCWHRVHSKYEPCCSHAAMTSTVSQGRTKQRMETSAHAPAGCPHLRPQQGHVVDRVKGGHVALTAVHHIHHVREGEGGLRNVGGQDDLGHGCTENTTRNHRSMSAKSVELRQFTSAHLAHEFSHVLCQLDASHWCCQAGLMVMVMRGATLCDEVQPSSGCCSCHHRKPTSTPGCPAADVLCTSGNTCSPGPSPSGVSFCSAASCSSMGSWLCRGKIARRPLCCPSVGWVTRD